MPGSTPDRWNQKLLREGPGTGNAFSVSPSDSNTPPEMRTRDLDYFFKLKKNFFTKIRRVEDRNDLGERSEDLSFSRGEGSGKDEGRDQRRRMKPGSELQGLVGGIS